MTTEPASQPERPPDSRDFISVWTTAMVFHLGLMFGAAMLLSHLPHRLASIGFWMVGAIVIATLKLMGRYSINGSDALFWGIVFLNALLYGLMYTLVWWHYSRRGRRRRGFPIKGS